MANTETITYSEAIAKIESILQEIDSSEMDIDLLSKKLQRASELIALCREKLQKIDDEVMQILDEIE